MIVGLGIDMVEINRIHQILERFGQRFIIKLLHTDECLVSPTISFPPSARYTEWVAGRFAAKEAAVKALGTGFTKGIWFHDIRICSTESGKPELYFYGNALKVAQTLKAKNIHLSLTHTQTHATATVILENIE